MGSLTRFIKADDQTIDGLVLTFTNNTPSTSSFQNIVNGQSLTAVEQGQSINRLNAQITKLKADIESLYSSVNAGE